jgi:TBC1 domain family member 2
VWQLILGYLPSATNQQGPTLRERRLEYYRLVESIFVRSVPASGGNPASGGLSKASRIAFNLVAVDVPRTHPDGFQLVFDTDLVRHSLERVLFVWAEQHSAVSYFQGLNDLAAMFYMVFLHAALPAGQLSDEELASSGKDINSPQMQQQLATALMAVEADVYWCMCSILDQLASQYSFNRGGVYSEQMVRSLENLLNRADPALHHHIKEVLQLDYLYFAFRWMLCLFIRELSPRNLVMLWDSFVLESGSSTTSDPGFAVLPIYIAAAYLMQLSPQISALRDSSAVLFILQKAPTDHWTKLQVHKLIASALQIKAKFPLAAVSDLGLSASINPS